MNLPIVDFQTAKDLKELGFDCQTQKIYSQDGFVWDKSLKYSPHFSGINAPTQVEVVKWLRDEHEIFVGIDVDDLKWSFCLLDISHFIDEYDYPTLCPSYAGHDTYESAELSGIKKAIEILKERS